MYEIHSGAIFSAKFWIVKIIYYLIAREWGVLVLSPCLHSSLIFPPTFTRSDCPHLRFDHFITFHIITSGLEQKLQISLLFIGSKIECTQKWYLEKEEKMAAV